MRFFNANLQNIAQQISSGWSVGGWNSTGSRLTFFQQPFFSNEREQVQLLIQQQVLLLMEKLFSGGNVTRHQHYCDPLVLLNSISYEKGDRIRAHLCNLAAANDGTSDFGPKMDNKGLWSVTSTK